MKSYKGKRKKNNKKTRKQSYSARLIKVDNKGNRIIIFNKNIPKSVIKKVLKHINKPNLCREMTRKRNISVGTSKKKRNQRRKYVGGAVGLASNLQSQAYFIGSALGNVAGPLGGFVSNSGLIFKLFGSSGGFLVTGATLATLMYAFKKAKIKPIEDMLKDDEIDYIENKLNESELCVETISNQSKKDLNKPWTKSFPICEKMQRRHGTNTYRREQWIDLDLQEEEAERQRLEEERIKRIEAEREQNIIT